MEYECSMLHEEGKSYFNSIKVRLEYHVDTGELIATKLFQFHKGAIGVTAFTVKKIEEKKFQFHKGAIGVHCLYSHND